MKNKLNLCSFNAPKQNTDTQTQLENIWESCIFVKPWGITNWNQTHLKSTRGIMGIFWEQYLTFWQWSECQPCWWDWAARREPLGQVLNPSAVEDTRKAENLLLDHGEYLKYKTCQRFKLIIEICRRGRQTHSYSMTLTPASVMQIKCILSVRENP